MTSEAETYIGRKADAVRRWVDLGQRPAIRAQEGTRPEARDPRRGVKARVRGPDDPIAAIPQMRSRDRHRDSAIASPQSGGRAVSAAPRPEHKRRVRRRRRLLRQASDRQVRLQVTADWAVSKHIGGSPNRSKAERRPGRARCHPGDDLARLETGDEQERRDAGVRPAFVLARVRNVVPLP